MPSVLDPKLDRWAWIHSSASHSQLICAVCIVSLVELLLILCYLQHYFNCPYQLGSHSGDDPSDSLRQMCKVMVGDVWVCGIDGLFDNLFDSEILALVEKHGDDLDGATNGIAH